jgi:Pro-kumamolisin, activation domain
MAVPRNYRAVQGSERRRAPGARRVGPADPAETLRVLIRVRRPPGAAAAPVHEFWARTKPGQRRFLSRKDLGEKYGAAAEDLQQVADFARAKGLTVLEAHAARRTVTVTGTVRKMNSAFGVDLGKYASADETYRGREGPVHVPRDVADLIEGVFGLDNRRMARRSGSSGPTGLELTPIDIANIYNFPPNPAAISDQTIGVLEFGGGYTVNPSTGRPSDIDSFIAALNATYSPSLTLSPINVVPVLIPNATNTLAGSASKPSNADAEVALDIDVAGSVANGATIAVYIAPFTQLGWVETILTAIFPDPPQPAPSVLSISWFSPEDQWAVSALQAITGMFQQAAEAGITVLSASGDLGSSGSDTDGAAHVDYPYCDPWVTCCGGTQISSVTWATSTTASGLTENTWNNGKRANGTNIAATGGGISTVTDPSGNLVFPLPSWQQGIGVPPSINDNTTRGRGIPDIAGYANGYNIFVYGGPSNNNGTSETAPLYAGLIARINATLGFNVGYLNPTLYGLASSPTLFRDMKDGVSNAWTFQVPKSSPPQFLTAPGYTSKLGWDACTGLGVVDGTQLIEALSAGAVSPAFYFSISKNTYGHDEVTNTLTWPNAFSLVLDGVEPTQLTGPPTFGGSFTDFPGLTVSPSATTPWPVLELGGSANSLQRITYPYDVVFSPASLGSFPAVGSSSQLSLNAGIVTTAPSFLAALTTGQFELLGGADPNFINVSQQLQNAPWLSQDLRVFTVIPGLDASPLRGKGTPPVFNTPTTRSFYDTNAAYNYIQGVIQWLNGNYNDPNGPDPFTTLLPLTGGLTGDSSVFPYTNDPVNEELGSYMNYNFAVARVRLSGAKGASADNVSVFFRLFLTVSNDTDYQPSTTYASGPQGAAATTPVITNVADPLTIPFFATGNYETNGDYPANTDYVSSGVNNQTLKVPGSDGVWAYFGCYLNFYNTNNTIDYVPINSLLVGTHHCLVAEISFADTPIATGTSTANSGQLAQRNLQITESDNPGPLSAHRVPQTFDLRPSAPYVQGASNLLNFPDEMMIDWGNVPPGSRASIYWPQVAAADVIKLASQLYPTHQLTASDPHTLNVAASGETFIPIPTGSGKNFAGLLTVDLPQTVVAGQEFTAVVRRLTTKLAAPEAPPPPPPPQAPKIEIVRRGPTPVTNWRYVAGSFAVTIPVATAKEILPSERDVLAIFRWRLSLMSPSNRWYPVLLRYIGYIERRISGLGGNPIMIQPSPYGDPASPIPIGVHEPIRVGGHGEGGKEEHGYTGKVEGLVYDRFGDFEGFLLETEAGERRRFRSREAEIEELVRFAWRDRVVITVLVEHRDHHCPVSIILRRMPRPGAI